MALPTAARISGLTNQPTFGGVPGTLSPLNHGPRFFEKFDRLPPELRLMIWEEALAFAYRVLKYERKSDDSTTSDIDLFSRIQSNIATVCAESRKTFKKHQGRINPTSLNDNLGILAVSPKLDIIHFGVNFELEDLKSFAGSISKAEAKEVRHLILEYQVEDAFNGEGGVRRTGVPRFYKICELLPELTRIIFVSHKKDRASNTLVGGLVFTTHDSTGTSDMDGITFKAYAEHHFPIALERQLETRRMGNARPEISFLEPVEISTLKDPDLECC
jgi:hypothetical protein